MAASRTAATVAIAAAAGATAAAAGGGGGAGAVAAAAGALSLRPQPCTDQVRGAKISALFITAVQCSKFFAAMRCTALLSALSVAVAARAEPFEHFLVHIWEIGGRGQGSAAMALVGARAQQRAANRLQITPYAASQRRQCPKFCRIAAHAKVL